jgi:hypothetical protein
MPQAVMQVPAAAAKHAPWPQDTLLGAPGNALPTTSCCCACSRCKHAQPLHAWRRTMGAPSVLHAQSNPAGCACSCQHARTTEVPMGTPRVLRAP